MALDCVQGGISPYSRQRYFIHRS